MNIFLCNYLLMIFEAIYLIYKPRNNPNLSEEQVLKYKKAFVIFACLQWILISGLRADSVGSDTANYMRIFDLHSRLSWNAVMKNFKNYFSSSDSMYDNFEPGYVLFEKCLSVFSRDHTVYKFVIATIFMTALGVYIYRNSEDPFLAFLLYNGMFYNMFSLTGYRQVVSVAIGILWGYEYLKRRKFIPFLILVLIASTFHKSTLIFLIFYFLSQMKISKPYVIISAVAVALMIILRNQVFSFVKDIVGYEEYGGESGFTQKNFLFMLTVLIILCVWRYRYIVKSHPEAVIYYNGLIMTVAMVPFAMVSPTSMRLVYDFAFLLMFLLPLVLQSFPSSKDRTIVYGLCIIVFAYFIAFKTPEYKFFWQ